MSKSKANVAQLPAKLYELLEPLTQEERGLVIRATMILFGDEQGGSQIFASAGTTNPPPAAQVSSKGAMSYFQEKNPKNKGEELAVAARYREINSLGETHTQEDLKQVITTARRNFDKKNFVRDMKNAKRQAGFFNLGTDKGSHTLSYYGQQFVDALPDRTIARQVRKPKKKSKGKLTKKSAKS